MIDEAIIVHGKDGYALWVMRGPLWAVVAGRVAELLCPLSRCALCGSRLPVWLSEIGFGRKDEDGYRPHTIGALLYRFGNWYLTIKDRRQQRVVSIPVTREFVERNFPDQLVDWADEDDTENSAF